MKTFQKGDDVRAALGVRHEVALKFDGFVEVESDEAPEVTNFPEPGEFAEPEVDDESIYSDEELLEALTDPDA